MKIIIAATTAAALLAFAGCTTAPDAATATRLERAERVQRLVIDCLNAHADRLHRVESDTRFLRTNAVRSVTVEHDPTTGKDTVR